MPDAIDIFLRPVQASDARLLLKWENDTVNWSFGDTKSKFVLSDIILLIESLEDLENVKQARFIIVNKSNRVALGAIDLFAIDFDNETASVGILVADQSMRNRGVGLKSLICLEEICIDDLGVYNLTATVHQSNLASARLFEKANYSKKKLTQDAHLKNADYIETLKFEKCLKN